MSVKFNQDVENERLSQRNLTWEYYRTDNYEEAINRAKDMGWQEQKVQVRAQIETEKVTYFIEPFEQDCGCPNILNYEKTFRIGPYA